MSQVWLFFLRLAISLSTAALGKFVMSLYNFSSLLPEARNASRNQAKILAGLISASSDVSLSQDDNGDVVSGGVK